MILDIVLGIISLAIGALDAVIGQPWRALVLGVVAGMYLGESFTRWLDK